MASINRIACLTVAVKDQEEALHWYIEKLGFEKRADITGQGPRQGMRWLTISPKNQPEVELILASWFPEKIGQSLPVILITDDCEKTYEELKERGVEFSQPPQARPYGTEAVFKDLYGNTYAIRQDRAPR